MTDEYRVSRSDRTGFYLLIGIFVAFGLLVIGIGLFDQKVDKPPVLIVFGLVALAAAWAFLRELQRLCVRIDENSLTVTHAFWSRSVLLDDIEGFRQGERKSILLDRKSRRRALRVPGSIERRDELLEWMGQRYRNIDKEQAEQVTQEVLSDEKYGGTEEERAMRLARARKIMLYSAFVAPLLFVLIFVTPEPFALMMVLLLAIPLAAVGITWRYKGIFRLYSTKRKPYPTLLITVMFAEAVAFIVLLKRFNIYTFTQQFWIAVAVVTALVLVLWARACREAMAGENNRVGIYFGLLVVAAVYSYNLVLFSNCVNDRAEPRLWRVQVERKHYSSSKSTTYYLHLSSWGRFEDSAGVRVPYRFYHSVSIGDSVTVYVHSGRWGAPWYEVRNE
jgi:hypothetical protein